MILIQLMFGEWLAGRLDGRISHCPEPFSMDSSSQGLSFLELHDCRREYFLPCSTF